MSKKKKATAPATKPCDVRSHFTCDGTGQMCVVCGESSEACDCGEDDQDLENCEGCDGAGRICVEHDSPCGDLRKPPQCDKVQGKEKGKRARD